MYTCTCKLNKVRYYIHVVNVTEFPKRDLVPLNNFDKTLMFNCASFRHFVQEGNEFGIQAIIKLVGYEISFTSCTLVYT